VGSETGLGIEASLLLYMDSSSIVKLYIDEAGSIETEIEYNRADRVATSIVAYAEVRAAFASNHRNGTVTADSLQFLTQEFDAAWPYFYAIPISEGLVKPAGSLAQTHALSGFDAIHLASALEFRRRSPDTVNFAVADARLRAGALAEGFVVI
jgi:predicted nucleic acid-binding protein